MKAHHIIAICDMIRFAQHAGIPFSARQIELMADLCQRYAPKFDRAKWYAYIRDGPPK